MRRDIGRHPNSDSRGAVNNQIGDSCGQDHGFIRCFIKIQDKINSFFINISKHLLRKFCKPCLCISVCCWRVSINRAKVSLTINKYVTHVKILGKSHKGIIDCGISMRMVSLQHFSYNTCTFGIFFAGQQSFPEHCIQYSSLNRLEPIFYIRQGPSHYYAHCVIKIRSPHFFFNIYSQSRHSHSFLNRIQKTDFIFKIFLLVFSAR